MISAEMLARVRAEAGSAVLSDAADRMDLGHRSVGLQLRAFGMSEPIVGWARPVRLVEAHERPDQPYATEIAFVDSLRSDDVVVVSGAVDRAACWGELLSTAATARGAAGAVIDALVRDVDVIDEIGFPVLARGSHPGDLLGRMTMTGVDEPLDLDGLDVVRGDLVVADNDGVAVISAAVAAAVVSEALAKAATESAMREFLRSGGLLRDAFDRFEVL